MTHMYSGIAAGHTIKTVDNAEIHSHADAKKFLDGLRERKIGANVIVRCNSQDDSDIGIFLYGTMILRYYSGGEFIFTNGGHNTLTTSTRINQFAPHGFFFYHEKKKLRAVRTRTGEKYWQLDIVKCEPTPKK